MGVKARIERGRPKVHGLPESSPFTWWAHKGLAEAPEVAFTGHARELQGAE